MDKWYYNLKKSPLFNLSLASRELFHSNFLYWLGCSDSNTRSFLVEVLERLLNKPIDWKNKDWSIEREYQNLDICIVVTEKVVGKKKEEIKKKVVLILENKVKSIPGKNQLDQYVKKQLECNDMILLSLATEFPDKDEIKDEGKWVVCNYNDLYNAMENYRTYISDLYFHHMIEDYRNFIQALHYIAQSWIVSDETCFFYSKAKEGELRINDLCDKIWYSQLFMHLKSLLFTMNWEIKSGMSIEHIKNDPLSSKTGVYINWGFTHGQGLLEAKVKINNDYVLLIQIQGNNYLHAIEWIGENDKEVWEMIKNNADIRRLRFFRFEKENKEEDYHDDYHIFEDKFYPLESAKNIYNSYGTRFLYQSRHIKKDVSVKTVLSTVVKEINTIICNYQ